LIGFSQGAILGHAIAQSSNIKNLVALSGYVDKDLVTFDNKNKTSIYISHGRNDEVIPYKDSFETNLILDDNNIDYDYKSFNQGHGVNNKNLESFIGWLKDKY
jgi:phospholipase/carboxylesterase